MKARRKKLPDTRRLTGEYSGQRLKIEYDLDKAFEAFRRIESSPYADETPELYGVIIEGLIESITSWSLRDDEDKILPITAESFEKFPAGLIKAMFSELHGALDRAGTRD